MTTEILTVLGILGTAVLLFISERIRVDVVALIVLVALAITGLVTPQEALSGFSNLAVITVWAVLILSGALAKTGVARILGRKLLQFAGEGEARLVAILMLAVGILSGFMNDIGVAALMLPVTVEIARRTGRAPSKLLMPLAFASLLGGLNTLIGTPPNILISEALREANLEPFAMFDYTPVGLVVMVSGIGFMALIGRHLLPERDIGKETAGADTDSLHETYELQERLFILQLPVDSPLAGKSVAECRLGSVLGVNLIGLFRDGDTKLAPGADFVLQEGDRLLELAGKSTSRNSKASDS